MIVRDVGSDYLLITQPDHAELAGRLMEAWVADGLPTRPTRAQALYATRLHDAGWIEEDAAPLVDRETGRPFDFVNMPAARRQAVWPRGIARLAETSTYAAALVAQHALTIYRRYRSDPAWAEFFSTMEQERDRWFTTDVRPDGSSDGLLDVPLASRVTFLQDYAVVRAGDLLSLVFCNGWSAAEEIEGYRIWLDGTTLRVSPDPFAGRETRFEVRSVRIPAVGYESDEELYAAIASGREEALVGRLAGVGSGVAE
jgi:hypothetical protein